MGCNEIIVNCKFQSYHFCVIILTLFYSFCSSFQWSGLTFWTGSNDINQSSRFVVATKFLRQTQTFMHINLGSFHGPSHWQRWRETCHVQGMCSTLYTVTRSFIWHVPFESNLWRPAPYVIYLHKAEVNHKLPPKIILHFLFISLQEN